MRNFLASEARRNLTPAAAAVLLAIQFMNCASARAQQVVADGVSAGVDAAKPIVVSGGYGVRALNGGTIAGSADVSISGVGGIAVAADSRGTIDLSGGLRVVTSGNVGYGVSANGAGSVVSASSVALTTTGQDAYGVYARGAGSVVLRDGSISTSGLGGQGMLASGAGSSIVVTDIGISTTGGGAYGAGAAAGGVVTLNGGSVSAANGIGLYVTGAGSRIVTGSGTDGESTRIATVGSDRIGAYATNGGTIMLDGGRITTAGRQSNGLFALGNRAAIQTNGVAIETLGDWGMGAEANNSSVVSLTGGSIRTSGANAYGLYAIGTGAVLTASGTVVNTSGRNAVGAYVLAGTQMTLDQASISTQGNGAHGAVVDQAGGSTPSLLHLSGGSVATAGSGAVGLLSAGNVVLDASDVSVSTTGDGSVGAVAFMGGTLTLNGGAVSTAGEGASGLFADGLLRGTTAGAELDATGVRVTTTGALAAGAEVGGGARIRLVDSEVLTLGAGAAALSAFADDGGASTATISNSTLRAANGAGVSVAGTTLNVALSHSTLTGGDGNLFVVSSDEDGIPATLNLTADGSQLSGAALTQEGSTANVALTGASVWTMTGPSALSALTLDGGTLRYGAVAPLGTASPIVLGDAGGTVDTNGFDATLDPSITGLGTFTKAGAGTLTLAAENAWSGGATVAAGTLQAGAPGAFSPASRFAVADGAILDLNGFSQTVSGLRNAGSIHMGSVPGTVMTVLGDYVGNGGTIVMNTVLGDSSSVSDRLEVRGGTSGTSGISIRNAGGLGAQTTGNGIMVVKVDGASDGTFEQRGSVSAGAYEYTLYKNGTGRDVADGNWYLRSTLEELTRDPDPNPGPAPDPDPKPSPTPDPIPNPIPIPPSDDSQDHSTPPPAYRPGVVGYTVVPLLNVDYGFSTLGTLAQRVGDVPGAVQSADGNRDGVWGRIGGQNLQMQTTDRFSADSTTFFAQFGKDWTLAQPKDGGSTHAGVTVTFGSSSADFADSLRGIAGRSTFTGSVETQAQSIGGYWTRYLKDGAYFDSVAQATHYRNRYSDSNGVGATQNGVGVTVSQEVGKPLALGNTRVAIEPQAQLMYQYLNLQGFDDGISDVSGTRTHALRGRIGFRLFAVDLVSESHAGTATPYFTADLVHDFLPPGQTTIGGTAFDSSPSRTWYQLGLGVTLKSGKQSELYLNGTYAHSVDSAYRQNVYGQAGYRYSW
jgi:outer membrane autotransporter protein